MQHHRNVLVASLLSFASGFALGGILAFGSQASVRDQLRERLRLGLQHLDAQMKSIDSQINELERILQKSRQQLSTRLQRQDEPTSYSWDVDDTDVVRELRHLPRR